MGQDRHSKPLQQTNKLYRAAVELQIMTSMKCIQKLVNICSGFMLTLEVGRQSRLGFLSVHCCLTPHKRALVLGLPFILLILDRYPAMIDISVH